MYVFGDFFVSLGSLLDVSLYNGIFAIDSKKEKLNILSKYKNNDSSLGLISGSGKNIINEEKQIQKALEDMENERKQFNKFSEKNY